jgi:cyclomaltodextrinase
VTGEPEWVRHAIWWRIYPLGFTGAYPPAPSGVPTTTAPSGVPTTTTPSGVPDEHRLLRIVPWLDHAVELGASGIALGPIFASTSHGYDTVDHFRIDPRLGDQDDFDELVAQAHSRGLRVQLDGVFNHVGRDHPLAAAALRAEPGSPAARMLKTGRGGAFVPFEGHDILLTLNHNEPQVQTLVVDVMRHWLDRGADAWRLDAAYAVPPKFWSRVLPQVRSTHPQAWFEAEVIHGDYIGFVETSTVDSCTQYELWKAIWSAVNDRNLFELAWALGRHNEMLGAFVPSTFIGNHDVTRIASRIDDPRHLPHAVVLLAVLGGTPSVYAGDEYGFRGVKEDRSGGDDAVRPVFPDSPDQLVGPDLELLRLYQQLIGLRRRHPWLHRAITTQRALQNEHAVFEIEADGEALILTLNLSDVSVDGGGGEVLAQDEASGRADGAVAAHGWRISAGRVG